MENTVESRQVSEFLRIIVKEKDALNHLKKPRTKSRHQNMVKKKCVKDWIPYVHGRIGMIPFSYTYVMLELRKCLLRHNWIAATKLLLMLLDVDCNFVKRVILKSCILILWNHPNSSAQLREDFLRMCSGVADADEMMKSLMTFPSRKRLMKYLNLPDTDKKDVEEEEAVVEEENLSDM